MYHYFIIRKCSDCINLSYYLSSIPVYVFVGSAAVPRTTKRSFGRSGALRRRRRQPQAQPALLLVQADAPLQLAAALPPAQQQQQPPQQQQRLRAPPQEAPGLRAGPAAMIRRALRRVCAATDALSSTVLV